MRDIEPPFEIDYLDGKVSVVEHQLNEERGIPNCVKKPLTLTVAVDLSEKKFWTSIPQGRQQKTEDIGRLIAAYIRSKKK